MTNDKTAPADSVQRLGVEAALEGLSRPAEDPRITGGFAVYLMGPDGDTWPDGTPVDPNDMPDALAVGVIGK